MKKICSWILVIVWMIVIFCFSNMNNNKSNKVSKKTLEKIIVEKKENKNERNDVNVNSSSNYNNSSNNTIKYNTEALNKPFRKVAHSVEFLILFILIMNALGFKNKNIFISLIVCFLYACSDEVHQLFIDGRTGRFIDVLIDMSGITIIVILYFIYFLFKTKRKNLN